MCVQYIGFIQGFVEAENVLLRILWVKRNAGNGTPADKSLGIANIDK